MYAVGVDMIFTESPVSNDNVYEFIQVFVDKTDNGSREGKWFLYCRSIVMLAISSCIRITQIFLFFFLFEYLSSVWLHQYFPKIFSSDDSFILFFQVLFFFTPYEFFT